MISENHQQEPLHQHHLADLESIPNQIGHAILKSSDGSLLSSSGMLSQNDIHILYQILLETGETMKPQKPNGVGGGNKNNAGSVGEEKLKKITIEGGGVQYSICVTADGFVYLIKRRSDE